MQPNHYGNIFIITVHCVAYRSDGYSDVWRDGCIINTFGVRLEISPKWFVAINTIKEMCFRMDAFVGNIDCVYKIHGSSWFFSIMGKNCVLVHRQLAIWFK
jgi:hypothetical protein